MKRIIIAFTIAICAIFAEASTNDINIFSRNLTADEIKQLSPEQRDARKEYFKNLLYKQTGGIVTKEGSQRGKIVYVNAQKIAPQQWLESNAEYFAQQTKINVTVEEGSFRFPKPDVKAELCVYVIDDDSIPTLLAAPEDRWCAVNVRQLSQGVEKTFFESRVKKELTRAFTLIAGGINSTYPGNCVGPVTKPSDLDKYPDDLLAVDVIARFIPYLSSFGIKPHYQAPYIRAIAEGWALPPTNDVQKAVWDRVKSEKERGPTNAIKIEPPKK